MADYKVTWKIEVEANSSEHAARRAYDAFCRPGSGAHVFEVTPAADAEPGAEDAERLVTTHLVDIDPGWDQDTAKKPVQYPMSREH